MLIGLASQCGVALFVVAEKSLVFTTVWLYGYW